MNDKNVTLNFRNIEEKEIHPMNAIVMLLINLLMYVASVVLIILPIAADAYYAVCITASIILLTAAIFVSCGFHIINPNEELVMTLLGQYYGTIKKDGFFFVNPLASGYNPAAKFAQEQSVKEALYDDPKAAKSTVKYAGKKISTKTQTLKNEKQKVNDALGNPVIIGSVVIWQVAEPTKAVFNVENYYEFLSIQTDSVIRNTARLYPYDSMEEETDEKTLRGDSQEIAEAMKAQLQEKVAEAGLIIKEVRITNLSYSDEIAAAMLQRQQAVAVIAARQKIVEGAVGMVKMAIDQLSEDEVVVLDDERKAAMVSNLLVVLCGNKDAQPVVNSSSIY